MHILEKLNFKQLVTERPWALETVLRMLLFLFVSYMLAMALNDLAMVALKGKPDDWLDTASFVIGALGFQGAVIGWSIWLLRVNKIDAQAAFGLGNSGWGRGLKLALGAGFALTMIALPMGWLISVIFDAFGFKAAPQVPVKLLQETHSWAKQILYSGTAILLAPIAEELLFRGILYPVVKHLGYPRLALIGTSLLFGAIHFNWMALIPLSMVALILTLLYEETGDLMVPIVAHGTFNLVNVILLHTSWFSGNP